jgi:hypothetical protein
MNVYRIEKLEDKNNGFFGIPEDSLRAIIASVENQKINGCVWHFTKSLPSGFEGQRGEKIIPTAKYATETGQQREITFFIKRHCNTGPNEAMHHLFLVLADAPVPNLYAYFSEESDKDITVSEYVKPLLIDEPYDEFLLDQRVFGAFIAATAEFTSVSVKNEHLPFIEKGYIEKKLRSYAVKLSTLETINKSFADEGEVYVSETDVSKLLILHENICKKIEKHPKGIYHWDHRPCNAAWDKNGERMLIIDLEDTLIAPRFLDIGRWLGSPDRIEKRFKDRESLAKDFLSVYNNRKENVVSVDTFLTETEQLWLLWQFDDLFLDLREVSRVPQKNDSESLKELTQELKQNVLKALACLLDKEILEKYNAI